MSAKGSEGKSVAVSTVQDVLPVDIHRVWETVTSVEDYGWRSDLSRTEIVSGTQFVEYTKDGYATTFTVTRKEPCARWEFDMENGNMKGHWTGVFTPKGEQTEIIFTENVTPKRVFLKPFVKLYLKRQQALFLADLKRALLG